MLKKLNVLAAAYRLRTFTVGELAAESRVNEQTVRSVLTRVPDAWLTSKVLAAGTRGGQPHRYSITKAGRVGIEETVGSLPTARSVAPESKQPESEPMGLSSARDSAERLLKAPHLESADRLRADALENLNWALAELDDGGFAANSHALREEIAQLFQALRSSPDSDSAEQSLDSDDVESTTKQPADRGSNIPERAKGWRAYRPPGRFRRYVIGYIGADSGALEMASFARGAIASNAFTKGQRVQIDEPVEAQKLAAEIKRAQQRESIDDVMVLVCVAKGGDSDRVESVIEQTRSLGSNTCVLDHGNNVNVANVTKRLRVDYQPNASEVELLTWLEIT